MNPKKSVVIFASVGLGLFTLLVFGASFRQGWFSPHESYSIEFPSGDGLSDGTAVSMSGLKAGRVTSVELGEGDKVIVKISLQRKFAKRLRQDSKASVGRPFIIGEKAISISPGSVTSPEVAPGSHLVGEESLEITDMLSGGRMSPYFNTFTKLLEQLRIVIEGDGGPDNANLVDVYKQAYRSLKSVESIAKDFEIVRRDFATSPEMRKVVKDVSTSSGELQKLFTQVNAAMPAISQLSQDLGGVMPQLSKTLGETVFTLQAMQRSFILRGAVADLKKEEKQNGGRLPASVPETTVESIFPQAHPRR